MPFIKIKLSKLTELMPFINVQLSSGSFVLMKLRFYQNTLLNQLCSHDYIKDNHYSTSMKCIYCKN